MWSSATSWWRANAAWATATTKHRSKNSSSTVALRCSSSVGRATIGRCQAPPAVPGASAPPTWSARIGRCYRPGPDRPTLRSLVAVGGPAAAGLGAAGRHGLGHDLLDGVDQHVGHPDHLPVALVLDLLGLGVVLGRVGVDLGDQALVVGGDGLGPRVGGQ